MNQDQHWQNLLSLIKSDGFWAHCLSNSGDSGVLTRCAVVLGGYVITEDGDIYPPNSVIRDTND